MIILKYNTTVKWKITFNATNFLRLKKSQQSYHHLITIFDNVPFLPSLLSALHATPMEIISNIYAFTYKSLFEK